MRQVKIIALIVLLVSATTVIAQNWEPVKTNILFWSLQPPLAALLIGTLVVGYGLGLLTTALWKVRVWRKEALAARKLASTTGPSVGAPFSPTGSSVASSPGSPAAGASRETTD